MRNTSLLRLFVIACLCSTAFSQPPDHLFPQMVKDVAPDPLVGEMLAQVLPDGVYAFEGSLSGEWPVIVNHAQYRIPSRTTDSGLPIQNATQYVYDHLLALGLSVGFQDWSSGSYSGRNVVGTILGTTHPDEIVLLTAHLDDMPGSTLAPGADDNASGSVGVLFAAEILRAYRFERTLKFVFFTGEEQGLLGSKYYATKAYAAGENIVAVCNLDMIGWDMLGGPILRLHIRPTSAEDLAIANVFSGVVSTYGLNLAPAIEADGKSASDHASFWAQGYPAILAIEDEKNDFNRYYHSSNDHLSYLNMGYFDDFVKAAVGTAASLAQPLGPAMGDYRAQLGPPAAMQRSDPAGVVTYSLTLTNTGILADTYQLLISYNAWVTTFPAEVGPLAPGTSKEVTIMVTVPPEAAAGATDIAVLTVGSEGGNSQVENAEMTTVVNWKVFYLPMILR